MIPTAIVVGADAWAKELERRLSAESLEVLRFDSLGDVPPSTSERRLALVIAARHLGLTECLAVQELRERIPTMTLVLSTSTRAASLGTDAAGQLDIAIEEGATVLVVWPPDTELLHGMLRRWCRAEPTVTGA